MHKKDIRCINFNKDESLLASASIDNTIIPYFKRSLFL